MRAFCSVPCSKFQTVTAAVAVSLENANYTKQNFQSRVFKSLECGSDRQQVLTTILMAASDKKPDNPPFHSGRAQRRNKIHPPLNKVGNVSGLVRVLEVLEERLYCSRV
jgi:hypothetical protein